MNIVAHTHSSTVLGKMYEGPKDGDFVRYVDQLLADNARKLGTAGPQLPALPVARPVPAGTVARTPQAEKTVEAATQMLERLKQAARAKEAGRPEVFGREPAPMQSAPAFNWMKLLGWLFMLGLAIALPPLGILMVLYFIGKHVRVAKK